MMSDPPTLDPTDPMHSYTSQEEISSGDMSTAFDTAKQAFPAYMDAPVTVQLLQDLSQMADIRFRGLFDDTRLALHEAGKTYDEANPVAARHTRPDETALPGWELTIGVTLDDEIAVNADELVERANSGAGPATVNSPLSDGRPVIQSADVAALYHTYYDEESVSELVCSYLAEDFFKFDYFITVTDVDLYHFDMGPLYDIDTDRFRALLKVVLEEKLSMMQEAGAQNNPKVVFEAYAAPLVTRVQDHREVYPGHEHAPAENTPTHSHSAGNQEPSNQEPGNYEGDGSRDPAPDTGISPETTSDDDDNDAEDAGDEDPYSIPVETPSDTDSEQESDSETGSESEAE